MKCLLLNARSAVNRRIDLQCQIYQEKLHVVLITESWGYESVSSELTLDGYRPERFDRKDGRKGGGVLMHLMDGIDYKREYKLEKNDVEALLCKIGDTLIGVCYNSSSNSEEKVMKLHEQLRKAF